MKLNLIILFFSILVTTGLLAQSPELIEIRNLSGSDQEEAAVKINKLLDETESETFLEQGYRSIAMFIMAKSSFSPIEKVKYFRAGRKMLESSILADVTSVELRYLRFCVQTNVPFFLNYSSNIEEDKRFILLSWNKISDSDLKMRIRSYMMRSEYCNDVEKKSFSNG